MIFDLDRSSRVANPALYDSEISRWWNYGELCSEVRHRELLLPSGKHLVFLFCRNDFHTACWYLACLNAGHAVAMLDDTLHPDFKARLIEAYRPEFVYTRSEIPVDGFESAGAEFLWHRREPAAVALHPELSLMLSTSGSTGSPKFVRLTRRNVEANAESISDALSIQPVDRSITSLPLHYSYGLSVLNTHLLKGASTVLTDAGLITPAFWEIFRNQGCTSLAGVPYSYQVLKRLDIEKLKVPTLHTLTQAGGKLPDPLVSHFHELQVRRGGRFFVMYGQTEATARIAVLPYEALPGKLGSAGLPISGGSVAIRTDDGSMTKQPGVRGDLVYTGPNVMMGYANSGEDLAAGDVLNGEISTGDTAYLDEDGYIYIVGRSKRDAKLFGLRVNMDEIEAMLKHHGPTAVVERNGKLVIFCEYPDGEDLDALQLQLAGKLHIHHSGLEFRRIDKVPVTPSGKMDYTRLAEL